MRRHMPILIALCIVVVASIGFCSAPASANPTGDMFDPPIENIYVPNLILNASAYSGYIEDEESGGLNELSLAVGGRGVRVTRLCVPPTAICPTRNCPTRNCPTRLCPPTGLNCPDSTRGLTCGCDRPTMRLTCSCPLPTPPTLKVTKWELTPEKIEQCSKDVVLYVTVKNVGSVTAENVKAELSKVPGDITSADKYLRSLTQGDEKKAFYKFNIDGKAKPGTHQLKLELSWEEDEKTHKTQHTIFMEVHKKPWWKFWC